MTALRNFERLIVVIEFVDETDTLHRELTAFVLRHVAQSSVKRFGSEEESPMREDAIAQSLA